VFGVAFSDEKKLGQVIRWKFEFVMKDEIGEIGGFPKHR
jgi:hypothetical protein